MGVVQKLISSVLFYSVGALLLLLGYLPYFIRISCYLYVIASMTGMMKDEFYHFMPYVVGFLVADASIAVSKFVISIVDKVYTNLRKDGAI